MYPNTNEKGGYLAQALSRVPGLRRRRIREEEDQDYAENQVVLACRAIFSPPRTAAKST